MVFDRSFKIYKVNFRNFFLYSSKKQSTFVDTISVLLRRGADPNASSLPLPPLVYAVRSGDVTAVKCLAEKGADINFPLPIEVSTVLKPLEPVKFCIYCYVPCYPNAINIHNLMCVCLFCAYRWADTLL